MRKGFLNVIGEKLKERGKTQGWLANETGLSKGTIRDLVNQKTIPKISTAVKIIRALNCKIEELFKLE